MTSLPVADLTVFELHHYTPAEREALWAAISEAMRVDRPILVVVVNGGERLVERIAEKVPGYVETLTNPEEIWPTVQRHGKRFGVFFY